MKHLIWECAYHEEPLPPDWQRDIQANENVMMWARGLVDSPSYNPVLGQTRVKLRAFLHKAGQCVSVQAIDWLWGCNQLAMMAASKSMPWRSQRGCGNKVLGK